MHWNALKMNKKIHKKIKCIKAHIFSVYFLYIEMGCLKAKYMESKRMFVRLLADRFQLNARCTLPLLVRVWWVKRPPALTLDRPTLARVGAPPCSCAYDGWRDHQRWPWIVILGACRGLVEHLQLVHWVMKVFGGTGIWGFWCFVGTSVSLCVLTGRDTHVYMYFQMKDSPKIDRNCAKTVRHKNRRNSGTEWATGSRFFVCVRKTLS